MRTSRAPAHTRTSMNRARQPKEYRLRTEGRQSAMRRRVGGSDASTGAVPKHFRGPPLQYDSARRPGRPKRESRARLPAVHRSRVVNLLPSQIRQMRRVRAWPPRGCAACRLICSGLPSLTMLLSIAVGLPWDEGWHITRPFDTPFSPPHLFIYATTELTVALYVTLLVTPRLRRRFGSTFHVPTEPFAVPLPGTDRSRACCCWRLRRNARYHLAQYIWARRNALVDDSCEARLGLGNGGSRDHLIPHGAGRDHRPPPLRGRALSWASSCWALLGGTVARPAASEPDAGEDPGHCRRSSTGESGSVPTHVPHLLHLGFDPL